MSKRKGFSIMAIILLFFQIVLSSFSLNVIAESEVPEENNFERMQIDSLSADEETITWSLDVNNPADDAEDLKINVSFDESQTHGTINGSDGAIIEENEKGYTIQTSAGANESAFIMTTQVADEEAEQFHLTAETTIADEVVTKNAVVTIERDVVEKAEENEAIEETNENTANENPEADEETSNKRDEKAPEAEREADEVDGVDEAEEVDETRSEEEGHDDAAAPETDEELGEEQAEEVDKKSDQEKEAVDETEASEDSEEVGSPSHSVFSPTMKPNALPGVASGDKWPLPGSLRVDKEAKATDHFAEWEVGLEVEGKNLQSSSDVVLVFDRSNSMYGSRARKAKAAAKEFVNNLLVDEHSTIRIAIVPFGSDTGTQYDPHTDFEGFSGKQTLLDAIDAIQIYSTHQSGGTNIHAGLHAAEEMLKNSTADQKTIVLMSDGAPTYSHRASSATSYSWPNNKYNFILSDFNYNSKIGSGSDYDLPSGFLGFGDQRYTVNGFRVTSNGIATISEAQNIINSGIDIYAIGLEVGHVPDAIYTLENSHNKGYFQGGEDDMSPIFEEIAASLAYAATNAVVTDPLGEMFDLVKDGSYNGENFAASHGTIAWDEASETFTWNIGSVKEGETYTLTYKVTLDCTEEPKVDTKYPTNKTTTMHYTDHNGSSAAKDFPIPKVKISEAQITSVGYRVNVNGEPIDEDGNVVSSWEEAQQFYEATETGKQPQQTYEIPAGATPEGYVLHGDFTDPAIVEVTNLVCNLALFGYVKESELPAADVIVKHVDEEGNELVSPETLSGNIGDPYDTSEEDIENYEFKEMHVDSADPTGRFTYEEQTVIYVYQPLKGTIQLIKVDQDEEGKRLAYATFDIINSDGVVVDTLVTDANGVAVSKLLPKGEYTLVEKEAPEGYELIEEGPISVTVEAGQEVSVTVANQKQTGSLTIIKVDQDEEDVFLEGAEFTLVDEAGHEQSGTTDANGQLTFKDLVIGTYTITEIKAPYGYELVEEGSITVTVEADQEASVTVTNQKQTGSLTIIKVDQDEKGVFLEGAEFTLVDEAGHEQSGTTDADGQLTFEGLVIGTYTLTETKAPEGYRLLMNPIEIDITPEELTVEKTIENTKQDWEIPKTGGIGTLGFYGIGIILMGGALWVILRRKFI